MVDFGAADSDFDYFLYVVAGWGGGGEVCCVLGGGAVHSQEGVLAVDYEVGPACGGEIHHKHKLNCRIILNGHSIAQIPRIDDINLISPFYHSVVAGGRDVMDVESGQTAVLKGSGDPAVVLKLVVVHADGSVGVQDEDVFGGGHLLGYDLLDIDVHTDSRGEIQIGIYCPDNINDKDIQ